MGSGSWDASTYHTSVNATRAAGMSTMGYTDHAMAGVDRSSWVAHADLDPKDVVLRESRDSDEHPFSVPVAVIFDVTGSMHSIPRRLQEKLPDLFGLLLGKGYLEDPQLLIGAVGDMTARDRAPLQVSQFESDNRVDEAIGNLLLVGGGGGSKQESYELALYFMARHTAHDSVEKRGHKGYLFIIGDEKAYDQVSGAQVRELIGGQVEDSIPLDTILAEAQEKYEVYFILPGNASHGHDTEVIEFWTSRLGQNVLQIEDVEHVCETIALTVGIAEGTTDLTAGLSDLDEIGSDAAGSVSKALAKVGARGTVATSDTTPADLAVTDDEDTERV